MDLILLKLIVWRIPVRIASLGKCTIFHTIMRLSMRLRFWNIFILTSEVSHYFMLLMDEASSFQTVVFLTEKIAENTLEVLKAFITEGER